MERCGPGRLRVPSEGSPLAEREQYPPPPPSPDLRPANMRPTTIELRDVSADGLSTCGGTPPSTANTWATVLDLGSLRSVHPIAAASGQSPRRCVVAARLDPPLSGETPVGQADQHFVTRRITPSVRVEAHDTPVQRPHTCDGWQVAEVNHAARG